MSSAKILKWIILISIFLIIYFKISAIFSDPLNSGKDDFFQHFLEENKNKDIYRKFEVWCNLEGNYTFGEAYISLEEKKNVCNGLNGSGLLDLSYTPKEVELENLRIITGFSKNHVAEAS